MGVNSDIDKYKTLTPNFLHHFIPENLYSPEKENKN